MRLALIAAGCLGSMAPASSGAQQGPSRWLPVVPRLTGPITVDGRLDEPAWERVPVLPAVMQRPVFGVAPSERTEFLLAHDDDYIYAAGRMYDSDPAGIRAPTFKRDESSWANDWFALDLDPFNDNENLLVFGVTPAGLRTDVHFYRDGAAYNFDWNALWDAAVRRTAEGWFAEIRVPLTSLRFQTDERGRAVMGVNIWRLIARKAEIDTWPAREPRWGLLSIMKASQAEDVAFDGLRSRRPLYLVPYVLAGGGMSHALDSAETGYDRLDRRVREVGGEVKLGVTDNLTLDLTFNTDFAQVEADDQQVNLTRFSLFFPEKRQFFQERSAVFEYAFGGDDRLFHSRRIGLRSGRPVPIDAGARLVGREGAWDVGLLSMRTSPEGGFPAENFGVVRLRRQVLNPYSYVGGMLTSRTGGGESNTAAGLDAILRLFGEDYLVLQLAQTHDSEEGDDVGLLDRALLRANWERRGESGLTYGLTAARAGPAFQPALGYRQREDCTNVEGLVSYGWQYPEESPLLRRQLTVGTTDYWRNEDGVLESAEATVNLLLESKSSRQISLELSTRREDLTEEFELSDSARVPAGRYRFESAELEYTHPLGLPLRGTVTALAGRFFDGWQVSASVEPIWNASRHLQLSGFYRLDHIGLPDRDQEFRAHTARLRALVMLDTRISLAAFLQYNSAVDGLFANARLRYNPREGDDLYIVFNQGSNTDPRSYTPRKPATDARTLLIKYTRTFDFGF